MGAWGLTGPAGWSLLGVSYEAGGSWRLWLGYLESLFGHMSGTRAGQSGWRSAGATVSLSLIFPQAASPRWTLPT